MPLDASDRIRKIQEIAIFQGFAIAKQTSQPGVDVSSCVGYHGISTIQTYPSYELRTQTQEGLVYFSTCQGGQ